MAKSDKDAALLTEILDNFDIYSKFWGPNYKEGDLDIQCLSVDGPWEKAERERRETVFRPVIHEDIISQYNRRITNQQRLSTRGITITPGGENADEKTAEKRENRIRQIGYESNAKYARLTALEHAVDRGIGFYMVRTDFARPGSFDQKIVIEPVPNPKSVLVDPHCRQADRSDMKAAFVLDRYTHAQFLRDFKGKTEISFDGANLAGLMSSSRGWITNTDLQVCSYWKVEVTVRTLLALRMPEGVVDKYLDEPEFKGATIKNDMLSINGTEIPIHDQREDEIPHVMQYITNGVEILKRTKAKSTTIPIIMIAGHEYYDAAGGLVIESATRKGRQAQMAFDYAVTNQTELIGQVPKAKFWGAKGQFNTSTDFENLHSDPTAYAEYDPKPEGIGEAVLGPPQLIPYDTTPIQIIEMFKQGQMIALENAMGSSSTAHQDKVAKSGKAIDKIEDQKSLTHFHFQDSSDRGLAYEGRLINEMLAAVEDTDTVRGFRKSDDKYETEQVTPEENAEGEVVHHPYGDGGAHSVVVEAGPDWQSQWDKVSDSLDELVKNPQVFPLVADLWIQTKKLGPKGDKMAERFQKALLPPMLQEDQQRGQVPPEIQQKMQQMTEIIKGLTEQLNAEKQAAVTKQQELDAKIQMNQENNETRLAVANIGAKVKESADQTAAYLTKMEGTLELLMQDRDQIHQMSQGSADREHAMAQQTQQIGAQQDQATQAQDLERERMQQEQLTTEQGAV